MAPSRPFRRRRGSVVTDSTNKVELRVDCSTSYQAGSSGPDSGTTTDEDTDDEVHHRGRGHSESKPEMAANGVSKTILSRSQRQSSPQQSSGSGDSSSRHVRRSLLNGRPFTRSRSPAILNTKSSSLSHRNLSPMASRTRHLPFVRSILPVALQLHASLPIKRTSWTIYIDTREAGECLLLIVSLSYAITRLLNCTSKGSQPDVWIAIEILCLIIALFIYTVWAHTSSSPPAVPASQISNTFPPGPHRPASPRIYDGRDCKRNHSGLAPTAKKDDFGFIWMSVPKNYRESSDDGISTGVLFGPLITTTLLCSSLRQANASSSDSSLLPAAWRLERPAPLSDSVSILEALIFARYNAVNLATLCSTILLLHVCMSWWFEARFRQGVNAPEGERGSVPRKEGKRSLLYVLFTVSVSVGALLVRFLLAEGGLGIWQHLSYFEVASSSLFFQFTLYVAIRLAHRGFALGELGLVCFGGTAIGMELLNITIARIWPVTTPFIKTYRLPTPLLIFQLALIAGSFLTGFLLSPLLVLSRHIAQRPVHRLRFPQEKPRHRRLLAFGFYGGAVIIVGGLIGLWTRWCLGNRDPWLWVIFWIMEGKNRWSRPVLLAYWGLLCSISLAGWNRQLARSRRYRARNANTGTGESFIPNDSTPNAATTTTSPHANTNGHMSGNGPAAGSPGALTLNFPKLPNGANVSNAASDLMDAADKHVPTLGLNARRKFCHALAVALFVPGIAYDPAFTHLSFGVAFALFTFAEYVRYFAIYPFGAAVHLFMNEFLDHKDQGTAILSHFYLLTGCAGSLWLEGRTQLLQFTGVLTLGVGDALASIVGKRFGRHRWSPTTLKTIEGSAAFTISIVLCAFALRICGFAEEFSTLRYTAVVGLSSVLEGLSAQNDNLTLPLYMWSMLVLADI